MTITLKAATPMPSTSRPEVLLRTLDEAEAKFKAVQDALKKLIAITSRLPAEFRENIYAGRVHNLDTPKEYGIWVDVENLKNMRSLSMAVQESAKQISYLRKRLLEYK